MPILLILGALLLMGGSSSSSSSTPTPKPQATPPPKEPNAGDVALELVGVAVDIYNRYLAGKK